MRHETTHNGHAIKIEYSTGMYGEHVHVYRDGVLQEHYIQSHGKTTCAVSRNCGKYGVLPCGEMMNTAADIYAQMYARYN